MDKHDKIVIKELIADFEYLNKEMVKKLDKFRNDMQEVVYSISRKIGSLDYLFNKYNNKK
ncbi:unnamed protein product [marine sediment metagenome]|uniref:Uncharacterized protein n=1 Tax=marine sediment metagenome TaxID=412755 RepID=X1C045_9ZZZZ